MSVAFKVAASAGAASYTAWLFGAVLISFIAVMIAIGAIAVEATRK
jgi:hypothetical protein